MSVHVLHVVGTLGFGGMERMLRNVVRGMKARGIESSIALVSDELELLDFGDLAPIHRVPLRPRDPRTSIALGRLIRKIRPSVIHARNFAVWPEAVLARAFSRTRAPIVVSYHGMNPKTPRLARRVMIRGLVEMTDHLFAVSEAAKDLISELYSIPLQRIEVLHNGVDTARFSPAPEPRGARRFSIGNVGRLFSVKNLALLVRAAGELAQRGLDFEVKIAGEGPEREALVALAKSLGVAHRVHLLGRTEDVPALLRTLDVFALTSDLEGHPNALLEAMATGLPCLATRVGSVPEVLDHGKAGILIAPGDHVDLADGIERLARDPELRSQLGARARARAVDHYGETRMLDAYESLYRRMAEGTGLPAKPPAADPAAPRPSRKRYEYRIVRAEPKDVFTVLKLLKRYVIPYETVDRYRWLYRDNPQGTASTWLALEPERGQIVGFTSIFARSFIADGKQVTGGVGMDAFVRPDHRRRGIAALLHRASLESMTKREVRFRFMCGPPVAANYQALLKIGSRSVGQMRFLHLPLTVPGLLRQLSLPAVAEHLEKRALLERAVERAWKTLLSSKRRFSARPLETATRDLDRLWNDHSPAQGIMGQRDAAFVGWRYHQNPMCRQEVIAVEDRGRAAGFAVLERSAKGALIVDNLFPQDPEEAGPVLRAVIRFALEAGAASVAVFVHDSSPANAVFTEHGFVRGRSASDFQVMCGDPALLETLLSASKWYMRAGDLDPESCHWSVPANRAIWTDPNYVSAGGEGG